MGTNWDKAAEGAADKTDKELAAGIERLITSDIAKLFPVPADAAKVRALCQQIRVKTAYNERVAAFKAISATLGADLLKTVKKAMFPLILMMVLAGGVRAQEIKTLDLSNPFADPRLGIALNLNGESRTVAYVPAVYFMPGGIEYATFNFGVTNDNQTGTKKLLLSVGPRIDTGIDRLSEVPWIKRNFKFIKLPPLQISPTVMTSDFKVYTWWVTIASKFGGK